MFRNLLTLLFCTFVIPGAMAADRVVDNTCIMMDDDDDKVNYPIVVSRPIVICKTISKDSADVIVKVRVRNVINRDVTGVVGIEIDDMEDKLVAVINDKMTVPAGKTVMSANTVTIKNPHLYKAEPKYRYEVEAEFLDDNGYEISEDKEFKFVIVKKAMLKRDTDRMGRKFPGRNIKTRSNDLKLERQAK